MNRTEQALHRRHGIWALITLVAVPLFTYFFLQYLHGICQEALYYASLTSTGEALASIAIDVLEIVIDCLKVLPMFALLGLFCVRALRFSRNRQTAKALVGAMALLLLYPLAASLFLSAVFHTPISFDDFIGMLLTASVNWLFDCLLLWLLAWLWIRAARKEHPLITRYFAQEGVAPRADRPYLRLLLRIALTSFLVRLVLCIANTAFELLSVGAPTSATEIWYLCEPYVLLAAQTAMGYLLMLWITRDSEAVWSYDEQAHPTQKKKQS